MVTITITPKAEGSSVSALEVLRLGGYTVSGADRTIKRAGNDWALGTYTPKNIPCIRYNPYIEITELQVDLRDYLLSKNVPPAEENLDVARQAVAKEHERTGNLLARLNSASTASADEPRGVQ